MISRLAATLFAAASLFACQVMASPGLPDMGPVAIEAKDSGLPADWHRRGVFMEILVRAYQDSDGDGIGDLNGLISRLDYLKSLGVTGIWLMPVFRSSDNDHGYTVVNYRNIERDYGTLADFDRLLAAAHQRGIGVIIDYVINHSSIEHPLFGLASISTDSPYRDWYVWQQEKPTGWTAFGGDPWYESDKGFYYGAFGASLPDFNLRNPAVVDFHLNNLKFWLNRGVDGFRFDAVGTLVENSSVAWENQPENHRVMGQIHTLLQQYGKRYMVCEAPGDPGVFSVDESCGSAFAFGLQKHLIKSVKMGRLMPDVPYMLQTLPIDRMGTLLSNHDAFAGNRLFQQFRDDMPGYSLAAATLLSLPGIPFLYYGEEIGLSAATPVEHHDQELRGPMSWSGEANAGFTTGKPFRPLVENHSTHHVANEDKQPDSLLNRYRQLITLRSTVPALSHGNFTLLSKAHEPVFVFQRQHGDSRMLVLLNYAARPIKTRLPMEACQQWKVALALPSMKTPKVSRQCEISLPAQQALFLQPK
ncbi:alpha-amylase family glycosyl hydrolase [Chitinivorax sp. B]|uniref:alpha-amylase family glycosyl hydrolase n=1 Tax=Chitinivorax sp. B TaxID=2502235 RepID=UPI0010F5E1E1|nr:alpha-amylase family glycosyl hydrolase [Chitinivorax sp. B]